ncbi:sperm-associated antigen 8 [Halichoeres trimaculatus]|uniref:sperm-associated antigen 8 n=1 Tax=Halichoeres trimaculatus TaxID=147232 RepID=UPI003D9DCD00
MNEQSTTVEKKLGRCMLHNWAEERAVAALDTEEKRIQRHGHRGILTLNQDTTMETMTTHKVAFAPPKSPGVRKRGIRSELLEKHIALMISEQFHAEKIPPKSKTDFCTTTQTDFCAEGFVPLTPEPTPGHDYISEEAVTFWSENRQRIQGVTAVQTSEAPFRKSAKFSTPISERLDEIELLPDG